MNSAPQNGTIGFDPQPFSVSQEPNDKRTKPCSSTPVESARTYCSLILRAARVQPFVARRLRPARRQQAALRRHRLRRLRRRRFRRQRRRRRRGGGDDGQEVGEPRLGLLTTAKDPLEEKCFSILIGLLVCRGGVREKGRNVCHGLILIVQHVHGACCKAKSL